MSQYIIYNPYSHLTGHHRLTAEEWARIKSQLSKHDLDAIECGGRIRVGRAAVVWKGA